MFLGHDDACILDTDLVEVDAQCRSQDTIRVLDGSYLQYFRIDSDRGGRYVFCVLEVDGLLDLGCNNRFIDKRNVAFVRF